MLVPYGEAWDLQKAIVTEKKALIERNEECCDTLIVLQHPPVYTLGTGSSKAYLNFNVKDSPYDVIRTERGGEVTYHGPGQVLFLSDMFSFNFLCCCFDRVIYGSCVMCFIASIFHNGNGFGLGLFE